MAAASAGRAGRSRGMTPETRTRLIEAAATTLSERGYARTSARTIAAEAGVNSALVFYHFGGVDPLLLAALDASSERRLDEHRTRAEQAHTLEELVEAAGAIYRADLDGSHLSLLSELVAAAVTKPELRPEITRRTEPWLELIEQNWLRVVGGSPLGALLPAREVAYAAITFYLGVNLFSVLDEEHERTEAVFALAGRLAPRAQLLTVRWPGGGTRAAREPQQNRGEEP